MDDIKAYLAPIQPVESPIGEDEELYVRNEILG